MDKVVVFMKGSKKGQVWEGDYDVALSPGNSLIISENGKLSGPAIKCIYNESTWQQVVMDDGKEDRDTK
jgi:hypothetical protein